MAAAHKSPSVVELERAILRILCDPHAEKSASAPDATTRREGALIVLRSYHWEDAEHRVVFEAIVRLPGRDANELQNQLPAQATRMGFPDVEWGKYFANGPICNRESGDVDDSNIEALIRYLGIASRETAS
jgi:hypothetical protein